MKPHKHAEIIKAWADGARIEYRIDKEFKWQDKDHDIWYEGWEYRVEPERKTPGQLLVEMISKTELWDDMVDDQRSALRNSLWNA